MISPNQQLTIYDEFYPPAAWQRIVRPGGRIVWAPNDAMREEHDALAYHMESISLSYNHATGGIKGSNILKNAELHAGNRYFFQLDIKEAYTQVDIKLLAKKLAMMGMEMSSEEIAEMLEEICVPPEGEGLAMGAPTSPVLFNIYCLELDDELGAYCQQHNITYTRYLDDLTFSSPDTEFQTRDAIGIDKRHAIRQLIAKHGLVVNSAKSKVNDLHNGPVIVTGIQINTGGKMQLSTRYLRAAKQQLRFLLMNAESTDKALQYASGLNGLLKVTRDPDRRMSKPERALFLETRDVIETYGAGIAF